MELDRYRAEKFFEETKRLRDELVEKDKRYYRLAEFCEQMKVEYEQKIKELTDEIERLRAQNETLEIIEKDWRFRNKELQKYNEGLAKNIEELEIEGDKVRKAYAHYEETTGLKQVRADTVRKMIQRIKEDAISVSLLSNPPKFMLEIREDTLDQIAEEMVEGNI